MKATSGSHLGAAVVLAGALFHGPTMSDQSLTCEQIDDYSRVTREAIYLGVVVGYVSGWADAQAERDGQYPAGLDLHRYGEFVTEMKIICEARPKWGLETAVGTAFADIRFGRLWQEDW